MELDNKMKVLIMIGAAQAVKCGPCLEHALNSAIEAGCSRGEVAQALAVGSKVRDGSHKMLTDQAEEQLAETLADLGIELSVPLQIVMDLGGDPCACSEA